MKRLIQTIALILSTIVSIYAQEQEAVKGVAILKTVDEVGDVKQGIKLNLRATLAYAINHVPGYVAYDRVNLDGIMDEHKFQRSGIVDDNQIKQIGKATGAQYILIAEVAYFDEQNITVTASIIDIETTRIKLSSDPVISPVDPEGMRNSCIKIARSLLGIDNNLINGEANIGGTPQNGKEWRIGYVNAHDIIQEMPEYSKAIAELEALSNQYQSDLKSMSNELEKKSDAFIKEKATLSDNLKAYREQELVDLYERIKQTSQENQQALQKAQSEKTQAITNKVIEAIKEFGIENNMLYVFDSEKGGIIINKEVNDNLTETIKYRLGLRKTNDVYPSKTSNRIGFVRKDEILSLMNITAYSDSIARQKASMKIVKAIEETASKYSLSFVIYDQSNIPFINESFVCDITTIIESELNLTNSTTIAPNKHINNPKFAYVNLQEIIPNMPEYSKAIDEIDALKIQYESELELIQNDLQKKADAFEREQANLPEDIRQSRETELNMIYQKLEKTFQDNQQALNLFQQDKMQTIHTKVLNTIKAVGQEGGYIFVMEEMDDDIYYISTTLSTDVTEQVKKKLDVAY